MTQKRKGSLAKLKSENCERRSDSVHWLRCWPQGEPRSVGQIKTFPA